MKKNNTVDTAQKSQTAIKNNVPVGKIKTIKSTENRRKAREEQYRNFRINALRRRCKRMNLSEEDIEKYVKKLIEQLDAPKQYSILIMLNETDFAFMAEALSKAKLQYSFKGSDFFYVNGDQTILAKIREIAPTSAKIYPYAKKMESILAGVKSVEKKKSPTNNTPVVKKTAKISKKKLSKKYAVHKNGTGKVCAKNKKRKSLLELKKMRKARIVQMVTKKATKGSKTLKKAA